MARKRVDDEGLLDELLELFREKGVEGVSLAEISAATGLEKASLYYRFPGGKEEMVNAVVGHVGSKIGEAVIEPLLRRGEDPAKRWKEAARALRAFYGDGERSCVVDTLSLRREQSAAVRGAALQFMSAFALLAEDAGAGRSAARRAEDAMVRLEGSLVMARALGEPAIFQRALREMGEMLLERNQAEKPD